MLHIEVLKSRCASTGLWRAELAKRYVDDPRNAIARDLLLTLAARPESDVSYETKQRLSAFSGPAFAEAIRLATKDVAFRYTPHSLDDVARRVVKLMEPAPAPRIDDPRFAAVALAAGVRQ
ncbi:MAG TPA: hypothetical protein VH558_04235 [Pseudolabrys sp.]|jgi:hypothetical protein